ncbi:MAG: hypothetical protein IJS06_01060 [Prevotella sp.]|nr:hypothetical protein [Prevotella sp.]
MNRLSHICITILSLLALCSSARAQEDSSSRILVSDTTAIKAENILTHEDSVQLKSNSVMIKKQKRDWATWRPDPKRALWMALVLPGAGQIYNRKFWKLPIFYGGIVGCVYAMSWNNGMYHDYAQAYIDISDGNPATDSYNKFLHIGTTSINELTDTRYKELFRNRKDRFRRWRDMSFFVLVGVYALSVIDAYVDASLSEFDISNDLSLRVSPAVINNGATSNPLQGAVGVNCSLTF